MSAGTPGPWFIEAHGIMNATRSRTICYFGESDQDDADLALVASAPSLLAENTALRSLIRRYANSWRVMSDAEGWWWFKPDPPNGVRREQFTPDELDAHAAVCGEEGVTWPI